MTPEAAHTYAREHGVSGPFYRFIRALATLILRGWFRFRVLGREHIPDAGPVIIAPNHKNFLDPFFVGIATRRRVQYMAKAELIEGVGGGLLVRLGAFPVRRGEADATALDTARAILAAGGVVVLFPEGTRVEEVDAIGSPAMAPAGSRSKPEPRSCRQRSRGTAHSMARRAAEGQTRAGRVPGAGAARPRPLTRSGLTELIDDPRLAGLSRRLPGRVGRRRDPARQPHHHRG